MRARILDAAFDLFQAKGYNQTSIQDITVSAGVTSGALHHHFPSKKALGLAVVEDRVAASLRIAWIEPVAAAPSVAAGIEQSITAIADALRGQGCVRGCPVNNLTIELAFGDPDFRAALEPLFAEWRQSIANRLAVERSLPRAQADAAALFVVSAYSGAMALAKAEQSSAPLETIGRLLDAWLEGLSAGPGLARKFEPTEA